MKSAPPNGSACSFWRHTATNSSMPLRKAPHQGERFRRATPNQTHAQCGALPIDQLNRTLQRVRRIYLQFYKLNGLARRLGTGLTAQHPSFESVVVQSQGSRHRVDASNLGQFGGGFPNGRRNVPQTNSGFPPRVDLLSEFTKSLLEALFWFHR